MRNLIKLSIVIVSIVIFTFCKKDDEPTPNNPSTPSITDTTTASDTTNTEDTTTTSTNHAPVAVDDEENTSMGKAVVIDVLANDTDADGDPLSITKITDAVNGSTEIKDNKITYTPNASYVGVEVMAYTISDGKTTATATLTISVGNNEQITTLNILSPYFGKMLEGVELTGIFGIRLNSDGTMDQMGLGLTRQGNEATWRIKDNGDIEFNWEGHLSTATVETYNFAGKYDGFSFNSSLKYVEHDPTSLAMYDKIDDFIDVQLYHRSTNGGIILKSDGTFSQTSSGVGVIYPSSVNGYWRISLYNKLEFYITDTFGADINPQDYDVQLLLHQVMYNSTWIGLDLNGITYSIYP